MDELIAKAGKVAVGIAGALIVGELTAIGANAAIDDIKVVSSRIMGVINPEPVKPKGWFRRK